MQLLIVIVLSSEYWAGPVALLLNYYLARKLYESAGKFGAMAWCLGLTLLLMTPVAESWGFKNARGVLYLPWVVLLFGPGNSAIHFGGTIVLSMISLLTSFITIDKLVKRAGRTDAARD